MIYLTKKKKKRITPPPPSPPPPLNKSYTNSFECMWFTVKWKRNITWKARSLLLASCGGIPMTIGPSFYTERKKYIFFFLFRGLGLTHPLWHWSWKKTHCVIFIHKCANVFLKCDGAVQEVLFKHRLQIMKLILHWFLEESKW